VGVAEEALLDRICETLKMLGAKRAMVVHGQGMDEISTLGVTRIRQLMDGEMTTVDLDPAAFGISETSIDELKTGDAIANAGIVCDILSGKDKGARRNIVLLNAAAAIVVAGLADDIATAIQRAESSIDDGVAMACLEKLIEISNQA
jgi:anthranilate phosphoribosyltransferase